MNTDFNMFWIFLTDRQFNIDLSLNLKDPSGLTLTV